MSALAALETVLSRECLARLEATGARLEQERRLDRNTHVRALKLLGLPVHAAALALEDAIGGLSVGPLHLGASFALDEARRDGNWIVGPHWTVPASAGVVPAGRIDGDVVTIDASGVLADGDDVAGGPLADSYGVLLERFDLQIADQAEWRIGLGASLGDVLAAGLALDAAPQASDSLARVWRRGGVAVVDGCSKTRRSYRSFAMETMVIANDFASVRAAIEVVYTRDTDVGVRVYRPPLGLAEHAAYERVLRGVSLSGEPSFEIGVTKTGLARRA
jgi:hypothetical protein